MPRQYGQVLDIQDYNPYIFEGTTIAPKLGDVNLLAQSIRDREQRQLNATQQQRELNNNLGEARKQLHNDEETKAWFDTKQKEIMDTINSEIAIGNYGNAMNLAIQKAGELANDDELQQRIKSNQDFTEYMDFLDAEQKRGSLSKIDYDYLLKVNKYSFNLNKDWEPVDRSVKSFNEDAFWEQTFKDLSEYYNRGGGYNAKYDSTTGMTYEAGGESAERSKTPERLAAFARVRLTENEDVKEQVRLRYNAYMNAAEDLQKQINELETNNQDGTNNSQIEYLKKKKSEYQLVNGNGQLITDPTEYMIAKQIKSKYPEYMGYRNLESSSRNKEKPTGTRSGSGGAATKSVYATDAAIPGPQVLKKSPGSANVKTLKDSRTALQNDMSQFSSGYNYQGDYPAAR